MSTIYDCMVEWKDLDEKKRKMMKEIFCTHWNNDCFEFMDHRDNFSFTTNLYCVPSLNSMVHSKIIKFIIEPTATISEFDHVTVKISAVNWNRFMHMVENDLFCFHGQKSMDPMDSDVSKKIQKSFKTEIKPISVKKKQINVGKKRTSTNVSENLKRDGDPVVLDRTIISAEDWYIYWNLKGKPQGPDDGWDIPSVEKFESCIKEYKKAKLDL